MESRNGKRSPGRTNGRRSSERQGRRGRSRSRTPIQRRKSSRYSPSRRRTRSRSLSPYRSRDLHHHGQRSSSSESRRRGNDDIRRPQFRGPENSKVLEKAERDRTRIVVYQNESASYDSKFDNKRLTSRERNRVTTNGNGRRADNIRKLVHAGHSRNGWRDRRTTYYRSNYGSKRAYDRLSTSRDRSLSPLRRHHDSRRNSDGKNHGRDYEYDRHYYDKLERSRGVKERLNSRRRGSRDRRAYEKYDDKKSTYKRGKDGRHESENYSKANEQESENNDVEIIDGSEDSNENEEVHQNYPYVMQAQIPPGVMPLGTRPPRPFLRGFYLGRPMLHPPPHLRPFYPPFPVPRPAVLGLGPVPIFVRHPLPPRGYLPPQPPH